MYTLSHINDRGEGRGGLRRLTSFCFLRNPLDFFVQMNYIMFRYDSALLKVHLSAAKRSCCGPLFYAGGNYLNEDLPIFITMAE